MQDNPRYEYAKATVPDDQDDFLEAGEPESVFAVAASMAREVVRAVERACDGDGAVCLMILRRALGMTYDEIGCLAGFSHVTVRKKLRSVVRRHPEMRGYLSESVLDYFAREELERRGIFHPEDKDSKRKALRKRKAEAKKPGDGQPMLPMFGEDGRDNG